MITLNEIIDLCEKYRTYLREINDKTIDKVCELAYNDIDDVIYPKHEYPIFLYYIVLCYLNDKGIKFYDLSDKDKRRYTEETIQEVRRVWKLDTTQRMMEFLRKMYDFIMPFKHMSIGFDTITYTFNSKSHAEDYCVLADMLNIKHTMEKDDHEYIVKLLF
ncbi:MAG: hypothetical protein [Wendovervirus sonii]|uniref:Uncharacterized protein n=1 Tax=phage Lak_Megaphage_Sonny TaxID=3109229 RepID=A0ABZ0Z537_9CAUD|nr:MAG: hypothetical protein [phage Lak_Megaphage_Sonny]